MHLSLSVCPLWKKHELLPGHWEHISGHQVDQWDLPVVQWGPPLESSGIRKAVKHSGQVLTACQLCKDLADGAPGSVFIFYKLRLEHNHP